MAVDDDDDDNNNNNNNNNKTSVLPCVGDGEIFNTVVSLPKAKYFSY